MENIADIRREIARLGDGEDKKGRWWYHPIDFGFAQTNRPDMTFDEHLAHPSFGLNKWHNYISPNLPDVAGATIIDVGCNCGIYSLEALRCGNADVMTRGADQVFGIEADPGNNGFADQAKLVRTLYSIRDGVDYSRRLVIVNKRAEEIDFVSRFGEVDLAFVFNLLYWSDAPRVLATQLSRVAKRIMVIGDDHVSKPLAKFESTKEFLSEWFEIESGVQYPEKESKAFNVIVGRAK